LKAWFDAEPGITGRELLDRLQATDPETCPDTLIRTVQRRVKVWRREHARTLGPGLFAVATAEPDAGVHPNAATTTSLGAIPARGNAPVRSDVAGHGGQFTGRPFHRKAL
jgi:hypothetical protein